MRPRRGYEAAAITKHADPGRRDDARHVADAVRNSDTGGLRRDYLETFFCLTPAPAPCWPISRYRSALFYAYGMRWIDFLGFTYAVAPGDRPAPRPPAPPSCPAPGRQETTGALLIIGSTTSKTSKTPPKTTGRNTADTEKTR